MNDRTHYIYGLFDPASGAVRYIGMSVNPAERLYGHAHDKGENKKAIWLNELRAAGQEPIMHVIEKCDTRHGAKLAEKYWIMELRRGGADLTNTSYPGSWKARSRH